MKRSITTLIFIAVLLLSKAAGATPDGISASTPATATMAFTHITVNEGLSSNSVRALLQDKYGYIWIGTERGLNRWDGYDMAYYSKTRGVPITALYEKGDTVWIGTECGLYLYSQQSDSICKFETNDSDIDISLANISSIEADKKGNILLASMTHGIMKIEGDGSAVRSMPTPDNAQTYAFLFMDALNNIWAVSNWTPHALVHYNVRRQRFEPAELKFDGPAPDGYPSTAMTQGSDGQIWMAASRGDIIRFNPTTLKAQLVMSREETSIKNAHSIAELQPGYFLIGSDAGLALYSAADRTIRVHTTATDVRGALSDNFVYPIIVDREGGTWMGTFYGGVSYYHPTLGNFKSHVDAPNANTVSGNVINHFCEDRYGRIWIASDDGGLTLYNPVRGTFLPVSLSPQSNNNVHALAIKDDVLYVGTYGQGISMVDINTLAVSTIPALNDSGGQRIDASSYEIMIDRQGRVWVGTFDAICLFDQASRTGQLMRRVQSVVVDMLQTSDGTLWFATEAAGLWSYSDRLGKWRQYDSKALFGDAGMRIAVNSLYEVPDGSLMVGTSVGLLRYSRSDDTFTPMQLPVNVRNVQAVAGEGKHLWLATNAGLCRYSLKENRVEQTFKRVGLMTSDFLPGAICRSRRGVMYVGTTHGFVSFAPEAMHHNDVPPCVRFTGLEVLNKRVAAGSSILRQSLNHVDEIRLSYRDNVVRLSFAALSFVQPSDNTYSYYLEGFDSGWIDGGNQHSVTYTNLSPGKYTFHVRATNNDGVFSPETTLRIVIKPPFYWNTPAQIIYIVLILFAAYFIVRRMMRKAEKRHKAEIEEIHTQKAQEIEEINTQKAQEIHEINIQTQQAIDELNTQKEQEVHEARIKFMTITPRDQEFLDRLEEAIEKNFSDPELSVDALAKAVGISRTGLFTKLKSLADVTPNEMIQVIRLKHAALLLQENRYRVSEVCYMVGFSSPSYFSKCFYKQYGVTPAKYV